MQHYTYRLKSFYPMISATFVGTVNKSSGFPTNYASEDTYSFE